MVSKRAILLFLSILGNALAQEYRATVSGLVSDPSQAPVAKARVSITSVERKVRYETETNEAGLYLTRFLPPGEYTLSIERDGFKKAERQGIRLGTSERLNLDIRLELGSVSESISVQAEATPLETESASRRNNIDKKFIEDVPTNGRNLFQFQYTQPGVVKTSRYWGSFELYAFGNINGVSINGGRSGENEILIDGLSSTRGDRGATYAPPLNAVEEVSIQSNAYDSQYGRIGGGVTSITLRSGTNQLHGQLFEFLKNDNLGANGFSRNAVGIRRPEFKNNTFGFTVDGPIWIPKVFNGRNKLFFVVSLESLRERNPQTQLWTVPTAAERNGDYSGVTDNSGNPILIYDPQTTTNVGGRFIRTPFASNRIPANRINPVSAKTISFYPNPNRVSEGRDGLNNYLFVNSSRNEYDSWLGKLDYNVSSKLRVNFRYAQTPWFNFARIQWGTNAAEPSGEFPSTRISKNWGNDWTYTLNPSTVINVRAGLARYEGFSGNTFGAGFDPRELGFPSGLVSQFTALQFPRFNFTGNNISPLGATQTSGFEARDTYSLQPNVQTIRGRHSMKFGSEIRRYNRNAISPASASGNYTFARNWTQRDAQQGDSLSGSAFASFLLGNPTSGSVDRNADLAYQNYYTSFFFQDDWKITNKLTLNLGMRWDYETPIVERYNRQLRGFAFDQASPIASRVTGLTLRGGLVYAGSEGEARQAFTPDRNNFQPRIGFAWQPLNNWVVRGGYGLFTLGQSSNGAATGFSRPTPLIASTDNNLTPAVTLSDPFPASQYPTGLLQPIGSRDGLATNLGQGVGAQYLARVLPYSQQFSFGLQRRLGTWLIDASYVGNLTDKLPVGLNLNRIPGDQLLAQPLAQRAAFFNAPVPNPMAGLLPGSGLNGATVPRQQLLFAYPQYANVSISDVPIGKQSYHSLQMKASRRLSKGVSGQVAYTFSKTLEQVSLLNAQDVIVTNLLATQLEKRLAEYDVPHVFSGIVTFELPFGKNRPFLRNANAWADAVVGGWNINTQYFFRSGQPIDFPNAAPNVAQSAKLSSAERDKRSTNGTFDIFKDAWFDTSIFPRTAQAPFTLRDFPTRFPDVRSPVQQSWEISVYKEFRIRERLRVQLRADVQNAFNQAYFGRTLARPNNVQDSRFGLLDPAQDNQPKNVVAILKVIF
jgi:hypothetical protein